MGPDMEDEIFEGGVKHRLLSIERSRSMERRKGSEAQLSINEHQVSDIGHLSFCSHSNLFRNNTLSVGIAVVKV